MHTAVCTDEWGRARGEADTPPAEHEHDQMSVPTIGPFRRDAGPAIEDTVSPPREHRSSDASRLSVPILIVIAMLVSSVTAAMSASAVYWMLRLGQSEAQSTIEADIRSIREGLAAQERIDAADKRAAAAELNSQIQSFESTKQSVDAMRGIVQLLQLQMAELLKQRK